MNGRNQKLTLDRLGNLLDAYGGDLGRWPEGLAAEAQVMIHGSGEARRLHAEAQALDRLLAKASKPDAGRLDKLAERIVAVAIQENASSPVAASAASARIIPMPIGGRIGSARTSAQRATMPPPVSLGLPSGKRRFGGSYWPAATALAASLAFGFAIGLSDIAPNATYNFASLVQPASTETDVALSELQLDAWNGFDEDQI